MVTITLNNITLVLDTNTTMFKCWLMFELSLSYKPTLTKKNRIGYPDLANIVAISNFLLNLKGLKWTEDRAFKVNNFTYV